MASGLFHRAVAERAAQLKLRIMTDVGEFEVPPDIALRYRQAKLTFRGRPDRRTKEGKLLMAWEAEFLGLHSGR
ncbi:MAG: hypothetical protein JWP25_8236 [Bradyrhizobium sp.]|nr:hypothetical protein [Bradyrhizobium sp.]